MYKRKVEEQNSADSPSQKQTAEGFWSGRTELGLQVGKIQNKIKNTGTGESYEAGINQNVQSKSADKCLKSAPFTVQPYRVKY